ncbi:DEAD/DEAH box helicase [Alcaligenes phenolicus]
MRQAEDRAYRMGQQRDVMVIVPLIPGTIDEAVWRILEGKRETEIDVVEAATMTHTNRAVAITNAVLEKWMQGESASLEHA